MKPFLSRAAALAALGGGWPHRRPVFLGEFGVYSRADEATRIAWTTAVRREAEARGFSWAYWELASSFGVLEPLTLTWRRPCWTPSCRAGVAAARLGLSLVIGMKPRDSVDNVFNDC